MENKLPNWLVDHLPEYEKVDSIPQVFSDSTHQLWRLQGSSLNQQNHFLKICSNTHSPFWQIMNELFDFDLRTEVVNFSDIYALLNKICSLEIPELIKAETLKDENTYILTSELRGTAAGIEVSDQMVQQLSQHLAELHAKPSKTWGAFNRSRFDSLDWSNRLKVIFEKGSFKGGGGVILKPDIHHTQALEATNLIRATDFVLMMPDLRWDQFLQKDNRLSALIDLDAFVYAPRELDFVILEYILTSNQIHVFSEVYSKFHVIPDISQVRPAYRLLLFYMQILGETDLDDWMNKETLF